MNIGQVYNITFYSFLSSSIRDMKFNKRAKLIFEGKYFYTFEYTSKSRDKLRTTVDKFELKKNPGLIIEV